MNRARRRPPIIVVAIAALASLVFVAPLVGLLLRVQWGTLFADLTTPEALDALRLSLFCTLGATAFAVLLGMPLAWVLARTRFPGRAVLRGVVLLPLVLPPVVGGVALLSAFSRTGLIGERLYDWFGIQLTFSTAGVMLAATFVAMPFFVITAEAALRAADQRYEDVAATLGAGPWRTFRRVTLPSIAPAVGAGAVLAGARALGEFGATITFAGNIVGRTQTLPLAIYMALQGDVNVAIGLSLVLLAVSLVVMVVAMRDRWTTVDALPPVLLRRTENSAVLRNRTRWRVVVRRAFRPRRRSSCASGPWTWWPISRSVPARCLPSSVRTVQGSRRSCAAWPVCRRRIPDRSSWPGNVVDDAGADVFVLPEDRNVGVLFQDDLLFPHMDLLDNVAFGPRARGSSAREAATVADEWLERVGVGSHRHSRPREVSGGQAQRAALARALVTEPDLLLLDEPLSALDASTRVALRRELREHLRWFGGATVLVTHDALDALALADRIVVLEEGRITQAGTLAEVAGTPRTPYAAELMATNLLTGIAHATTVTLTATPLPGGPVGPGGPDRPGEPVVELGPAASGVQHGPIESSAERELVAESPTQGVSLDPGPGASPSTVVVSEPHEGPVLVLIRPSSVTLHREPPEGSPRNRWPVEVVGFDPLGDRVRVRLAGPVSLTAEVTASAVEDLGLVVGVRLWCAVKATDVVVVDR